MNFQAFEEEFGEVMCEIIRNATLLPTEGHDKYLAQEFSQSIPIDTFIPDKEVRERVIQHYLKFFEELIDKLAVQAAELVPNLEVEEDLSTKMMDMLRVFLTEVLSGDIKYAPYMEAKEVTTADELSKAVYVTVNFAITRPEDFNDNRQRTWWSIQTDAYERHPENPDAMRHVKKITDRFEIDASYKR